MRSECPQWDGDPVVLAEPGWRFIVPVCCKYLIRMYGHTDTQVALACGALNFWLHMFDVERIFNRASAEVAKSVQRRSRSAPVNKSLELLP